MSALIPRQKINYNKWVQPIVLSLVVLVGLGASVYLGTSAHTTNKIHMNDRVNTLAQIIKSSDILALSASSSDLANPSYIALKKTLSDIRSANHDIRFIYVNGIKNGELFFYLDSENPDSSDYSPPGESYPEATPLMHTLFETKQNGFEVASDRWGLWVSAYAPIIDEKTGNMVALVGIDIPGYEYVYDILSHIGIALLATIIILALMISAQYIRRRERMYVEQKEEFLFIASHEIRTPLAGIRWASESVLSKYSPEFRVSSGANPAVPIVPDRKLMQLVLDSTLGLINRVNNLLDISAFESGRTIALVREPVSIQALVSKVCSSLELTALARNVSLVIDPSITESVIISCDREKIWHVLVNLISNAIKYTNVGTEILISYAKDADMHTVSVSDHGQGMTDEEIKHIFDGYHRTAAARHSEQYGTGLGLYLCEQIARMHGGKIKVDSTQGKGSTFIIVLK